MAIRWSPGCKCCGPQTCDIFNLPYRPSSPLTRKETAGIPAWTPVFFYHKGDKFTQRRLSDGHTCVWEVTSDMQSGPAWLQIEEDRYSLVLVASRYDSVPGWERVGTGWGGLSEEELSQAIRDGKVYPNCGWASTNDVLAGADGNWIVTFGTSTPFHNRDIGDAVKYYMTAFASSDGGSITKGVSLEVETTPAGSHPPGIAPLPMRYELRSGDAPVDETWGSLSYDSTLANTIQPDGVTLVGQVTASETPRDIAGIFGLAGDIFSGYVVKGSGRVYANVYDENDASTFYEVEDGDVLVLEAQLQFAYQVSLSVVRHIRKADLAEDSWLLGGGMQVATPGAFAAGNKVAVYCESARIAGQSLAPGFFFSGASGRRTATTSTPTCSIVDPSACPCPNGSEFYPITPGECPDSDYSVLLKSFGMTVIGSNVGTNAQQPYGWDSVYEGPMGNLQSFITRTGLCSFRCTKATVYQKVYVYDPFPPQELPNGLFRPGQDYTAYKQCITVAVENITISWSPKRGRFVEIITEGRVGHSGYIQDVKSEDLHDLQDVQAFYPVGSDNYRYELLYGMAYGVTTVRVQSSDFPCSGWSIVGTYTDDLLPSYSEPTRVTPWPVYNTIIGDTWTAAM